MKTLEEKKLARKLWLQGYRARPEVAAAIRKAQYKHQHSLKYKNRLALYLSKEDVKDSRRVSVAKFKKTDKYRAWQKAYQSRPDVKKRNLESVKRWQAKPGVKEMLAPGKRRLNLALGLLKEDSERMRRMADYICRRAEA